MSGDGKGIQNSIGIHQLLCVFGAGYHCCCSRGVLSFFICALREKYKALWYLLTNVKCIAMRYPGEQSTAKLSFQVFCVEGKGLESFWLKAHHSWKFLLYVVAIFFNIYAISVCLNSVLEPLMAQFVQCSFKSSSHPKSHAHPDEMEEQSYLWGEPCCAGFQSSPFPHLTSSSYVFLEHNSCPDVTKKLYQARNTMVS